MVPRIVSAGTTHEHKRKDGRDLYQEAFRAKEVLLQAREYEAQQLLQLAQTSKIVPTSKVIMEKVERSKLVEIFQTLDGDGDGVISANRIDVEALDPLVTKVISPVLSRLADMKDAELEQEEFITVIQKFAKVGRMLLSLCLYPRSEYCLVLESSLRVHALETEVIPISLSSLGSTQIGKSWLKPNLLESLAKDRILAKVHLTFTAKE